MDNFAARYPTNGKLSTYEKKRQICYCGWQNLQILYPVGDIARVIKDLAVKRIENNDSTAAGIFHFSNTEMYTKYSMCGKYLACSVRPP